MYRIMLIDDEYAIHLSLRKLVERSGLHIVVTGEAEDGVEALQMLEDSRPDIIVTDICMPEMDGLEFIRRVGNPILRCISLSCRAMTISNSRVRPCAMAFRTSC